MSAPVLDTKLAPDSDTFRANAAHNRALAERLRADVAKAALGGSEKSRERHVARGKLLPRDRVERLFHQSRILCAHAAEREAANAALASERRTAALVSASRALLTSFDVIETLYGVGYRFKE